MGMADGSTYMMYSYADGEIVDLGYSEGTEYIPGEGVYSIDQFWGAGGSSETCKWDGKECKRLWYGEWELDFDQPVQGQDGSYGHKYQSNGKVVPEAQYNAEYDRYIDRDRTVTLEYDKSYEEMVRFLSE